MINHDREDSIRFFREYGLSSVELASLLDIPASHVREYLFQGKRIASEEMAAIDMAIRIVEKLKLRFTPKGGRKGNEDFETIKELRNDELNRTLKRAIEEEKAEEQPYVDEIMVILGFIPGDFCIRYDPLCECGGLSRYGVEADIDRIKERISKIIW